MAKVVDGCRWLSMDVAGRGNVGETETYVYINVDLIRPAKVAVIVRGHFDAFVCLVCFRVHDMKWCF